MDTGLFFTVQSLLILILIYIGVLFRRNRSLHVKIQMSAIFWDIILILQIELTRQAIHTASKALINPMMLNIHISLALATVVFYGIMFKTGRKILKGSPIRNFHRVAGWTTLTLRTLVFITSFFTQHPH